MRNAQSVRSSHVVVARVGSDDLVRGAFELARRLHRPFFDLCSPDGSATAIEAGVDRLEVLLALTDPSVVAIEDAHLGDVGPTLLRSSRVIRVSDDPTAAAEIVDDRGPLDAIEVRLSTTLGPGDVAGHLEGAVARWANGLGSIGGLMEPVDDMIPWAAS